MADAAQPKLKGGDGNVFFCCWFWCCWEKQAVPKHMKGIQTLKRRLFLAVNCFLCSQNRNFAGKYLKISKPFKVSLTRKKINNPPFRHSM